jgi:hypothetical protein
MRMRFPQLAAYCENGSWASRHRPQGRTPWVNQPRHGINCLAIPRKFCFAISRSTSSSIAKQRTRGRSRSAAGALFQLAKLFSLPTLISVVPEGNAILLKLIAELTDNAGFAPADAACHRKSVRRRRHTETIAHSGRKVLIVAGFMMEAVVLEYRPRRAWPRLQGPRTRRRVRQFLTTSGSGGPAPDGGRRRHQPRSFPSAPSCRPTSRPNAESKCSQSFKASRSIERTAGHRIVFHLDTPSFTTPKENTDENRY